MTSSPDTAAAIESMAAALAAVPGVAAVTLGGSRARGDQRADSDWDIGVYYHDPLDVGGLRALAAQVTGAPPGFAARAGVLLASPGGTPEALAATVTAGAALVGETRDALAS